MMEIGTIELPAYLYNTSDAVLTLVDNRRYTMRDIGKIEDRVENLETLTSLSLLNLILELFRLEMLMVLIDSSQVSLLMILLIIKEWGPILRQALKITN